MQSTLSPNAPAAAAIAEMTWLLFVCGAAIFLCVLAVTLAALRSRPSVRARLAGARFVAGAGIAFPVVALTALLAYIYVMGERLHAANAPALTIEVTGEQWWWRVRYLDAAGKPAFETANEVHIPVGQPVELVLMSADVIHSFWVPGLAGKIDMIPGRTNRLVVMASNEGDHRGQCAEFCGGPHALMALFVFARGSDAFEAWRAQQLRPAAASNALFDLRCAACHALRGQKAAGTRGPDLTHVATRSHIAAATLTNTPDNMAAWLADSQHMKPGNLMPSMRLAEDDVRSLAKFLASLQ